MDLKSKFQSSSDWPAVTEVAGALLSRGHLAYLAGGSVRDALLGEDPKDFDLVTDATETELHQIFPKSYSVGKSFGVLIVPAHGTHLEVAQFRKEGSYQDGRHPDSWERATPEEDAQRRDFTVNALFYDLNSHQVLDYVGGLSDLTKKSLRCVGDPEVRLAEDRLRLFRAVRLAAQLGFKIDEATESALRASADKVFEVSQERRKEELLKLLASKRPHLGIKWMADLNWLSEWQMGLQVYGEDSLKDAVYGGILQQNALSFLKVFGEQKEGLLGAKELSVETLMLALLLAPYRGLDSKDRSRFPERTAKTLKEMHKFSSAQAQRVSEGLDLLSGYYQLKEQRQFFWQMASRTPVGVMLHELLGLEESAIIGSTEAYHQRSNAYEFKVREAPQMWVKGKDLMALGLTPSPEWGDLLKEAYRLQVEGEFNEAREALSWVKSQLKC